MEAIRFPWNGATTSLVACEMLVVNPFGWIMRKTAEPRYPVGHALVVAQVGVLATGPLAGFSSTAAEPPPPPLLPFPPVPGSDEQAPSSITATADTASNAERPSRLGSPDLRLIAFIVCLSYGDQHVHTPEPNHNGPI